MITPYTKLSHKVDSLTKMADSLLNTQQSHSDKLDSIGNTIQLLAQESAAHDTQLNGLTTQLQSIADYGIGFSDTASHITIPLIIALFAFAFPFLFTVISHINNKYESEHITELFSSEPFYKWFLRGAGISAIYLIIVGLLSNCLTGSIYRWLMLAMNWTSIIVAGGYSIIILCFVKTCIDYNNPKNLIGRVEVKFWRGAKESASYLKSLEKKEKKKSIKKKIGRRFRDQSISIGKSYAYYGVEDTRTLCLVELCKYSFKKNDYNLFLSILLKVDKLPHPDKRYEYQRFSFFEQVVEAYLYEEPNAKIEESLIRNWFSAFNKTEEPNRGIVYKMLGKMVDAAMQGRLSIFEQYIHNASYGFNFINQLQIVSYVRGKNVEEQKSIDRDRIDYWLELCEMHYIALAYLFSAGKLGALKTVLSGKNTGYGKLFPSSGTEILKLFARCKEHQGEDGSFNHYWFMDKVVGNNTDPEMLEKLTSLLLLIVSEASHQSLNLISKTKLKLIYDAESKMAGYADIWVKSVEMLNQFPQIGDKEFKTRFDSFVEQLEDAEIVEQKIDDRSLLIRVIHKLMKLFCEKTMFEQKEDIYQKTVPEEIKKEVEIMFWSILHDNSESIFDVLKGEDKENKKEEIQMGLLNIMTYKRALIEHEGLYTHQVFNNMINVFKSRYLFMIFQALSNMHITDVAMPIDEFEKYFDNYVGEKGTEYFILDANSHMDLFYEMDKQKSGHRSFDESTYKGAGYKLYDLDVGLYLKDVIELESFRETLVVIKKNDLPTVANTTKSTGPSVEFRDESSRENGVAAVCMTVNPNYCVKYCRDVDVLRVKLEPMRKK